MARPKPVWLDGHRGRKKVVSTRWYLRLDDRYGVMSDRYNLILVERIETNGKVVPVGRAYTWTMKVLCDNMARFDIDQGVVGRFWERVQGVKSGMVDGKFVVTFPEGFETDPSPYADSK